MNTAIRIFCSDACVCQAKLCVPVFGGRAQQEGSLTIEMFGQCRSTTKVYSNIGDMCEAARAVDYIGITSELMPVMTFECAQLFLMPLHQPTCVEHVFWGQLLSQHLILTTLSASDPV